MNRRVVKDFEGGVKSLLEPLDTGKQFWSSCENIIQ